MALLILTLLIGLVIEAGLIIKKYDILLANRLRIKCNLIILLFSIS